MNSFGDYWRKNGKLFLSFFAVAAFLPVMLLGVMSPDGFRLFTQADETTPLRIWFEPGSAVARRGDVFTLKVMAEYDDANKLIPRLEVTLRGATGVKLSTPQISYGHPFVGKVQVGEVEVAVSGEGDIEVEVVEGSVNTTLPDLPVVSVPAKISVR